MSAPTLSEFTAELRKRNIARPNLYYIQLVAPSSMSAESTNLISMWCSNAMTPQVSIMTNDDYIEAGIRRKYAYEYDYQNLVLQFYIDQAYDIKKFFDEWKQKIVPHHRNFNYPDDYTASKLQLYILNMEDKVTYQYEYLNVFPKTIQSVDLSYANGNQVSQFSVEFVFTDFNFIKHSNGNTIPSNPTINAPPPQTDAEYNAEINNRFDALDEQTRLETQLAFDQATDADAKALAELIAQQELDDLIAQQEAEEALRQLGG